MLNLARRPLTHVISVGLAVLAAALPMQAALADEITLRDGSRLIGKVVSGDNGTLGFKTGFAGVIKVPWEEVVTLDTDQPIELLLADDSIMRVNKIVNSEDSMLVESESADARVTLDQEDMLVVNPEAWRKGEGGKFSGHANLALQRQRGNTDKSEIDLDADMIYRRRDDRFKAFGELEKDRAENKKINDAWKLDGNYDYFVTRQWYWGGFVRLEHDQFADLNLRTSAGPLVGYQWFEGPRMNLSTSTGLSYVTEDFATQEDDEYAAIPWNINFDKFLLGEFMQFYHRQSGFWSLEDSGDVNVDTWTGLRFPLVLGLVASTELKVSYDGGAADSANTTDTTYSLKLGYQW